MTPALRRLYAPEPVAIAVGSGGAPAAVGGAAVEAVREEWEVDDRWWTTKPLRRRYFELALADGRAVVVFRSDPGGRWYRQRA
jgi:hypothetical protein